MAFLGQPLTRAQIAQNLAQEYANSANIPANTGIGSDLGAIFNSEALNSVILQQQVAYVNSIARLATIGPNPTNSANPNPDVDSFVNPFNVFRNAATAATGQVIFSVPSPAAMNILIPAITTAQLAAGVPAVIVQTTSSVQYAVVVDTSSATYSPTFNAYVISAGQTQVAVTVQCTSSGINGNALANTINQVYSGPGTLNVAGISSVTNPLAFNNAVNVESDAALKVRFALVQSTGTVATANATGASTLNTALNLTYSIGDQVNQAGQSAPGNYCVIVNTLGTGTAPSAALLTAVGAACLAIKPLGITFLGAFAPTLIPVNLVANIQLMPGYTAPAVIPAVQAAFAAYVNNVGLNPTGGATSAKVAALYAVFYGIPGVKDVTALTLNGTPGDVVANFGQQVVAGTTFLSPYF